MIIAIFVLALLGGFFIGCGLMHKVYEDVA